VPPALPALRVLPALQRTLAVELQRLSIQFRKQQKAYLNRLRSKDGGGGGGGASSSSGFNLMDEGRGGQQQQQQEDYDPGFSDMQASKQQTADR
jgi:syntaxin 16